MPTQAVINALQNHKTTKRLHVIAIGKAAWTMAKAASDYLGDRLISGIVITKYNHSRGALPHIDIFEAGHPVSDENTILATQKCIKLAASLTENDELLFLISGGGSALFEAPADGITLEDVQNINAQLLASGADIVEINMIRKRLSSVKAGRFASLVAPCDIFAIVLSDVLGDRLDSIASGPVTADMSTTQDAMYVVEKYNLILTEQQKKCLMADTPKEITNVKTAITGSVRTLCDAAANATCKMGYTPFVLATTMNCEAREAGRLLASMAVEAATQSANSRNVDGDALYEKPDDFGNYDECRPRRSVNFSPPCAIILGGETVVTLKGNGKGGRNQEFAFAAAKGIAGFDNIVILSLGSDGTDGPTDAAGGIVDGTSFAKIKGYDKILANNDTYNGLKAIDGLIITGPTGTNVNDVAIALIG